MVSSCILFGCSYRHKTGDNIGMFRFPKDKKRRQLWINAVKRESTWSPSSGSRICGKHFQTGKPSKDKNHPDYVPNVFSFAKVKESAALYEKRKTAIERREKSKSLKPEAKTAADALILSKNSGRFHKINEAQSPTDLDEGLSRLQEINVAQSLLDLAEGLSGLPNINEVPLDLSLGSSRLPDVNEALSPLNLDEGSGRLPEVNVPQLFDLAGGYQTQSVDLQVQSQLTELEELRAKVKEYEEKISIMEAENSGLKVYIGRVDKEMRLLREERNILQKTVLNLKPTDVILRKEKTLKLYTGLPSIAQFNWLVKIFSGFVKPSKYLSTETQLLIVLMKLKLALLNSDIACRFQISSTTVRRILKKWIPLLAGRLQSILKWPSKRTLKKTCPPSFRGTEYRDAVCIIDCTEVPIQRASTQLARAQTWSCYKNSQTVKFLVATAPAGNISFVSKAYGGRTSDKEITLKSGFMDKISRGDLILGDRGFILEDHFKEKGAKLVVPSFTKGRKQLSKYEIMYTKRVANLRIHVERIIKQMKRFRILQNKIPISFLRHIDNTIIICAVLSNFASSVVS